MISFRDFSFAVYTAPGVADECLRLQDDHGVDVNILLFCAYAAAVGRISLSAQDLADIDGTVADFRDGVVVPLRTCRRIMKRNIAALAPEQARAAEELRGRVKDIELAAELLEQDLMVAWLATTAGRERRAASVEPKDNIGAFLARHQLDGRTAPYPENLERAALSYA